ncbi:hypothetical protein [Burkholderia sp. Ax-1719]|uniref:hypothetical protein n=1 Tax=Burkholderia sp. Ax-1719 TaxID=2608334 RepID=UPI0014227582|nr:hypothetical protein [Burkholderia sp. Ax-1719]NIE67449.1 hypothetical protein [Burkholderia sp. Ax-1719]
MSARKQLQVDLPKEEAESLEARAAMQGIPTDRYVGYHVLRSYRGVLHPEVIGFEQGNQGQTGTTKESA